MSFSLIMKGVVIQPCFKTWKLDVKPINFKQNCVSCIIETSHSLMTTTHYWCDSTFFAPGLAVGMESSFCGSSVPVTSRCGRLLSGLFAVEVGFLASSFFCCVSRLEKYELWIVAPTILYLSLKVTHFIPELLRIQALGLVGTWITAWRNCWIHSGKVNDPETYYECLGSVE